eukprot:g16799.t1
MSPTGVPPNPKPDTVWSGTTAGTSYTEDLTLDRLGKHHVAARFVFRSHWVPQARHRCQDHEDWHEGGETESGLGSTPAEEGKLCHFEAVFPRAVGVLLDRFKMRDLTLQMSKGKWDTAGWGNGPGDGASGEYTPGGAEMWARLPAQGAWESWVGLRRSMSGLYCSSLDGMDEARVHTPAEMTMPGEHRQTSNDTTILRGTLPREPVCTENLIPLIKMLPCRSKAGLGSLLHPMRLFQSDFHSISVRASATFSDTTAEVNPGAPTNPPPESVAGGEGDVITSLTLEQTVLAVFRPRPHLPSAASPNKSRGLGSGDSGKSGSDGTGTGDDGGTVKAIPEGEGWSVSSLLLPPASATSDAVRAEMLQLGGCPVATRSAIHVVGGKVESGGREQPPSDGCAVSGAACDTALAGSDVVTRLLLPVGAESESNAESQEATTSGSSSISDFMQKKLWDDGVVDAGGAGAAEGDGAVAQLGHYLSGRGGTRGVSVANLVNMHPTSDAFVDFLQPVPYFMEPLLGTLRARLAPSSPSSEDNPSALYHSAGSAAGARAGPLVSLARNVTFTPGEGRRPAVVEARLWVPAASTVVLGFDFFKRFLTVDDFPPDPSRGFDIPPPLARFFFAEEETEGGAENATCKGPGGGDGGDRVRRGGVCPPEEGRGGGGGGGGRVVYAYGEATLLDTPQPDFSMPFNVITFTSTVITFFLGTAINLLVRKSRRAKKKKDWDTAGAPPGKDGDGSEQTGNRTGGPADGRHRWFDRPRRALSGALGGLFGGSRGPTGTGRRIQKELGRLKGD